MDHSPELRVSGAKAPGPGPCPGSMRQRLVVRGYRVRSAVIEGNGSDEVHQLNLLREIGKGTSKRKDSDAIANERSNALRDSSV